MVIEVTFDHDALSDVLERMTEFLRGCGFMFNGELGIVDEDGREVEP